ncbi:MAG: class I SAM-dependent methyltransferase, partial [Methylocella sp.]
MQSITMDMPVTAENFDEAAYLAANPDVMAAVKAGVCPSGRAHFDASGWRENRHIRSRSDLAEMRRAKMERLRPCLRQDMPSTSGKEDGNKINYLTQPLRAETHITDTENISGWAYDSQILQLVNEFADGLILDCGAGRRPVYFSNVVNYEIVDYDTTDIIGVGERLPFRDNTFDAALSLAVLEHVRDPMQCANEIARVLKPGGKLVCQMPFLQPLHGYPHHYFNATHQGLRRLFEDSLQIERVYVPYGLHPIFALQWIIQSWANGLSGDPKQQFLDARMSDFMVNPVSLMDKLFVTQLPEAQ